jgi:type III secretion system low calcium response chaperone LcrH/SycD
METSELLQEKADKLPSLSADSVETLYSNGYELYRNGKYEDAKAFFKILTLLDPSIRRNWMGLGACHQMIKEYDTAIACYGVAAVINPDDPYAHWHAADCFFQKDEKKKAVETLSSAIITAKQCDKHLSLVAKLELLHTVWSRDLSSEDK